MISKLIEYSARNRFLVLLLLFFACALLIRAARDLLIPFFLSASYVLGRFTDGPCFLPGMDTSRRVIRWAKHPPVERTAPHLDPRAKLFPSPVKGCELAG